MTLDDLFKVLGIITYYYDRETDKEMIEFLAYILRLLDEEIKTKTKS